jgi:NifU-like protein involved in Fe-S cluster formation
MDEAVIKYYRRLLKEDFPNSGSLVNPSIFIEAVGEKMINCGNTGNYMQLYLQVIGVQIAEIKYLCACEPVANVAVEVLCTLVKGKTLEEAVHLTVEPFYQSIGSQEEKLCQKVLGVMELMKEGIERYHTLTGTQEIGAKASRNQGVDFSWDGTLST